MSHCRLFKSTIDDQNYLHLQLAHNVYKIDYELYGNDSSLYKGIHINKGGECCLTFPVQHNVQYFIKFIAIIKESHLSLFHDSSRKKYKKERVEFTKFYKVGESLDKEREGAKGQEGTEGQEGDDEEDNIYTNIEKAGLDFTTFFENSMTDNESETGSHKLVSLFKNVRNEVDVYDLEVDSDTDNDTESIEIKSVEDISYSAAEEA